MRAQRGAPSRTGDCLDQPIVYQELQVAFLPVGDDRVQPGVAVTGRRIARSPQRAADPLAAAAPRSCLAPGNGGETQISRPAGSAMTCTFTPWHLCLPEEYGRSLPEAIATRSIPSRLPSMITYAFPAATAMA